jgi:hypothetical protein
MYYGQTGARSATTSELRKAACEEGGAIGFIEEIDAIGAAAACGRSARCSGRTRRSSAAPSEGTSGVVNELLIQLQSFDAPGGGQFREVHRLREPLAAPHRRLKKKPPLLEHPGDRCDQPLPTSTLLRPGTRSGARRSWSRAVPGAVRSSTTT